MATSKLLQIPQIIEIKGSTIRVSHPSTQGNVKTFLRSPIAASGTAMSVADNSSFADDDWMIVGSIGDSGTEEVDINGTVTVGSSLTVTNTLKFGHEIDAEVTKIFERGIKIYGAATDGGAGTLIASIDAITTPIADATPIQWDKPYTEFTLISTDTTYAYYYVKFTDGTTDSSASPYVLAAGVDYTAGEPFITQALDLTDSTLDESFLTRDMCVRWLQNAQEAITQFTYQDPLSGRFIQKDWSFEVIEDKTSISLVEDENEYLLSLLTNPIKYANSQKAIIGIRIGSQPPLGFISIDELDEILSRKPKTTVATQPAIGATSLVLTDASEINSDGGTVTVRGDTLTYTGISTNTLTGIPASGTGSITATHPVGASVWQNTTSGLPRYYTIFNGSIVLDRPVPEDYVGQKLKIRYLYSIPRITTVSSETVVPFTNVFPIFLSAKIEMRKRNFEAHKEHMDAFNKQVLSNALADMIPVNDEFRYYNFNDDMAFDGLDLNTPYCNF